MLAHGRPIESQINIMNFTKVFSKEYIFNPAPSPESNFYPILLAVFGAMVLFGILTIVISKKGKTFLTKFVLPALTCGILGLVHVFGRYESLPFIATRFYLLIILAIFFIWVVTIAINVLRNLPRHKKMEKIELRYNKYLPKSKKRD
jgi:hypothetical protein